MMFSDTLTLLILLFADAAIAAAAAIAARCHDIAADYALFSLLFSALMLSPLIIITRHADMIAIRHC
jgi:hypothetical protein